MAHLIALVACFDVLFSAFFGLMTDLVTFETHFLIAVKRVMVLLTAENTCLLLPLIWAVCLHVAELEAIVALDGWVLLRPISLPLEFTHPIVLLIVGVNLLWVLLLRYRQHW